MKKHSKKPKEEQPEEGLEADKRETVNECDEQNELVPEKGEEECPAEENEQMCPDALSNPRCPYVTQINLHASDLHVIKTALLGDDGTRMRGGIVFEISCLKTQNKVNSSWVNIARPIAISVATAAITAVSTYFITH